MNESEYRDESAQISRDKKLLERLLKTPWRFDFFHAVRLLKQYGLRQSVGRLDRGQKIWRAKAGSSRRSVFHFRTSTTLDFPDGAISRIGARGGEAAAGEDRSPNGVVAEFDIEVSHFGFVGPSGVLPRHYTDLVISRVRKFRDYTLRHFLDVFLNRFVVLLYQAWAKYRGHVEYENERIQQGASSVGEKSQQASDPLTVALASLTGIKADSAAGRLDVPDDIILFHAANLLRRPRTAESLEKVLRDVFSLPVEIVPFAGGWLTLEEGDRTRLADVPNPSGQHAVLGKTAIAGSRLWDCTSAFEIRFGPLTAEEFRGMLPGQPRLGAVEELVRFAAGPQYSMKIRLLLAKDNAPECRLAPANDVSAIQPCLGWSCWLVSSRSERDFHDETEFCSSL